MNASDLGKTIVVASAGVGAMMVTEALLEKGVNQLLPGWDEGPSEDETALVSEKEARKLKIKRGLKTVAVGAGIALVAALIADQVEAAVDGLMWPEQVVEVVDISEG